jgi:hypothetical protein
MSAEKSGERKKNENPDFVLDKTEMSVYTPIYGGQHD